MTINNNYYKKSNKRNPLVPTCPYCKKPLVRVFQQGGVVKCNSCDERLDRPVSSDPEDGTYVKCPYCNFDGPELINPTHNTKCPNCGKYILKTHVNM